MSRLDIWKVCNRKNPELEKFLAGISEKTITRGKLYTQKEIDSIVNINTPRNILPLKIYPKPHSVILVKNKFLEKGFAIFDANGYVNGPRDEPYVDTDNHPFYIKSKDSTYELFDPVSPQRPLNRGEDSVNPGYCGIFSIIFMVYFRNTSDLNGWDRSWVNFVNTIREPFVKKTSSDSIALQLAAEVQLIIKNNTSYSSMEVQILEKIKQYFYTVKILFPEKTTKRKRTDFGKTKDKYMYNNRLYKINIGPRGGRYIIVRGNKRYI
tara:strand:+ start:26651 stop:27448 length:798 start_codon:yes stop_codon:yes gene_type:complete